MHGGCDRRAGHDQACEQGEHVRETGETPFQLGCLLAQWPAPALGRHKALSTPNALLHPSFSFFLRIEFRAPPPPDTPHFLVTDLSALIPVIPKPVL